MSEKVTLYTIDPDTDGFNGLENLTYQDVVTLGDVQGTSPNEESALELLVYMLNAEMINTEEFIVVVNETTEEIVAK